MFYYVAMYSTVVARKMRYVTSRLLFYEYDFSVVLPQLPVYTFQIQIFLQQITVQ